MGWLVVQPPSVYGKSLQQKGDTSADSITAVFSKLFQKLLVTEEWVSRSRGLEDLNQGHLFLGGHTSSGFIHRGIGDLDPECPTEVSDDLIGYSPGRLYRLGLCCAAQHTGAASSSTGDGRVESADRADQKSRVR